MEKAHIKVSGLVQGVFFRIYTQKKAQELEITGWVRNMPDGTVKIEAQGEKERLEALVKWCYKGSPSAKVDKVEVMLSEDLENFTGFAIK